MTPLPTPQQLRYLVTLAETGHFGRAASACAVSQSTLSAGILVLERQLNAQILDRSAGKHVAFTALGLELVAKARHALAALASLADTADAARAPMAGPLRLGIIPTVGPFLLPSLMPALRARYPALQLFLREDQTAALLAQLQSDQLDVLLLAEPCACMGTESLPVKRDEFLAVLPMDHPLAAREEVPVSALVAERLLLLEDGHCLRDQVLSVCGANPMKAGAFAATSLHTLIHMVAGGLGVTLVPRLAVAGGVTNGAEVALRRLEGAGTWRTLSLAWQPASPRAADYRALAPLIAGAVDRCLL
ncbi:MAG: LysR family transcriptional regulator [Acidocella sp. 20-57-95]|nr:MAG: LysR family transcriptional regulator [Acidocella sp. 20-57-95]OYV61923.1 MAG: LysR family transcriptional regulator [Acidocella sp. 21-58-7]HQT63663.1 hydrogen peroxide-inducible genes activator [Acidocella sp.]HQU04180.1 hydrogen peroxide-inducible genes activator [Acidocella sp.]